MDEDEMMLAKQQTLFEGPKTEEDQEEDWSCKKINSPGGTWYLVKKEADREIYEKPTQQGRRRAVFSRNEVFNFQQSLVSMSSEDRQQWLADMILFKVAIPGTRIETLRIKTNQKNQNSENYEEDDT